MQSYINEIKAEQDKKDPPKEDTIYEMQVQFRKQLKILMEHYGVHLEKIDIMPFQNRVQSMCANQKAFLQYRKNRMALIEDHEGRKFKGDAAHIPFHITMIENEKRIAAEERERLQEEAPALTKADSFDSDELIHN